MPRPPVVFDEARCCALALAFLKHPTMVAEWQVVLTPLELYYEILGNTKCLQFTPDDSSALLYRAFALAEVERLDRERPAQLLCWHSPADHRATLEVLASDLNRAQLM